MKAPYPSAGSTVFQISNIAVSPLSTLAGYVQSVGSLSNATVAFARIVAIEGLSSAADFAT